MASCFVLCPDYLGRPAKPLWASVSRLSRGGVNLCHLHPCFCERLVRCEIEGKPLEKTRACKFIVSKGLLPLVTAKSEVPETSTQALSPSQDPALVARPILPRGPGQVRPQSQTPRPTD